MKSVLLTWVWYEVCLRWMRVAHLVNCSFWLKCNPTTTNVSTIHVTEIQVHLCLWTLFLNERGILSRAGDLSPAFQKLSVAPEHPWGPPTVSSYTNHVLCLACRYGLAVGSALPDPGAAPKSSIIRQTSTSEGWELLDKYPSFLPAW